MSCINSLKRVVLLCRTDKGAPDFGAMLTLPNSPRMIMYKLHAQAVASAAPVQANTESSQIILMTQLHEMCIVWDAQAVLLLVGCNISLPSKLPSS